MSLATMKKKSGVLYRNLSVRQNGFSLNGGHRSAGYIGQSTQSRHLTRTLMKGNVVRGNGGCCGTYVVTNVKPSELACLNNPNVIKPSVENTEGMLHTKYKWFWSGRQSVKPDSNQNAVQSDHTSKIAKKTMNCIDLLNKSHGTVPTIKSTNCGSLPALARPRNLSGFMTGTIRQRPVCPTTKDESYLTQEQYIEQLDKACTANDPNPKSHNSNCPLPGTGI
jgi:hypothetical protein